MKGESKEKKIREVRVLRREKGKGRNGERKAVQSRFENVSLEASVAAVAIRVHCFLERRKELDDDFKAILFPV